MFLNSKGSENATDPDIAAFLRYVDGKAAEGHFVENLDREVHFVKSMDKVRREYMILSDEIRRRQREAKEEGLAKGLAKGIAKGIALGEKKGLEKAQLEIIKRMLQKGQSIADIADQTGISEEEIARLTKLP